MSRKMGDEDPETNLLSAARHGELERVRELLTKTPSQDDVVNINCKGQTKSNLGWSPLHLATYFGHKEVVQLLLENNADVNVTNDIGDTPLHKAAHTGRLEFVMLLLQYNAHTTLVNNEGQSSCSLARDPEIIRVIEAAEATRIKRATQKFLKAAQDGDSAKLEAMLKEPKGVCINCSDNFGNTALHLAAYKGHQQVAVLLLQNGIDTSIKNNQGLRSVDQAQTTQMKQLLDVKPIRELKRGAQRFEGALMKRSKLLGWKPFWTVLERGVISLFKSRADASTGVRRKAFKYLDGAKVRDKEDAANIFMLHTSDGSTLTFAVDPDASAGVQRQKWHSYLEEHIVFADHFVQQDTDSEDEEMKDIAPLGSMAESLKSAAAHQQLLESQVQATNALISTQTENGSTGNEVSLVQIRIQLSQIGESSQQMVGSLSHCLNLLTQQEELRKLQLAQEMEKSRVLQEALHVLAEEHHDLEQSLGGHILSSNPKPDSESDIEAEEDDEFYDCDNDNGASNTLKPFKTAESSSDSEQFENAVPSEEGDELSNEANIDAVPPTAAIHGYRLPCPVYGRTRLPVPCFSRNDFSIWSILKQCIGKELSKITMPVIFNEPLSFLQRIVEYMEYSTLLKKAADCDDPIRRLEYVTAFAVSATASNWERIGKPFNPLLGETYELVREDLGFRIVSEQVSHHPPVSAFHAESASYTFHGAIHPKLKFWGKSVEVTPKGIVTVELHRHGEVYTWQNVNCCVHNIIVGKLWIELYGAMEVLNHKTKHKAVLNFKPSGWFGKDLHKIEGFIYDGNKKKQRALYGKWVEGLYSYDVDTWENYNRSSSREQIAEGDVPGKGSTCNLNLPNQRLLWLGHERPSESSKYYNFSLFAMMLNETTDENREQIPPTDCRLRPDLRKLEEGDIDGAGGEKHRLEEKQRAARKERKKLKEEWKPRWFKLDTNAYTGKEDWKFNKEYWEHKNEGCPDIF